METGLTWITTYTGKRLTLPPHLPIGMVDIIDIAHALSMICRFNGHCAEFYSVAQHSVFVSRNSPPQMALAALLHDAAEAYVGDMVGTLKRTNAARWHANLEFEILESIFAAFEISGFLPLPTTIKMIDRRLLAGEMQLLKRPCADEWSLAIGNPIVPKRAWSPEESKDRFLSEFDKLRNP